MKLAAFVLGLSLLTPLADRGLRVMRVETVAAAGLMVLNGAAHITGTIVGRTVATVRFERPGPGFWSSPLMIAAVLFIVRARHLDGVTEEEGGTWGIKWWGRCIDAPCADS
jgi:hypothetical protein